MGCDIHCFVEVRKDGIWEHYDWRKQFVTGTYTEDEGGGKKVDYDKLFEHPLYIQRNYDLFAMLANVRNGYGFAVLEPSGKYERGRDTCDGFTPLTVPRGLPDDVTDEVRADAHSWSTDGHSHSFITVQELLDYEWDRTTGHRGWVNAEEYREYQEKGKPSGWCASVGGGATQHIEEKEMVRRIMSGSSTDHCYTQVEWTEKYSESAGAFYTKTLPALQQLGEPEDVRLVFFFDN